jgi:amidase
MWPAFGDGSVSKLPSRVPPPTREDVRELSERYHLGIDEEELDAYRELIASRLGALERLDALGDPDRELEHTDRQPGYRPGEAEDPHNAIAQYCRVKGADGGALEGYTVGVKDNVSVASVPMTCGSRVMEGYVPDADAFVVERLLEEAATVTAKTNMSEMAVSGSGELGLGGAIVNPHSDDHLAGGSSGGSAVAVVTGDVDVAIGTDQAGSVRVPAAWNGCVGLKPTHGLVSYRGIAPLGHSFDHVGPIAPSVSDTARVLDVIVGDDPLDPRQAGVTPGEYLAAASRASVDDLTVGVLAEGFAGEYTDPGVEARTREAIEALADAGAGREEVSVPFHEDALAIALAIQFEDIAAMWESEGTGQFVGGHADTGFASAFANARRASGDAFAPTVKHVFLMGGYLRDHLKGRYYNVATNLTRELRAAYDDALESVDLLAMPTTPMTAFERADVESDPDLVNRAQGKSGRGRNTMPFDMTGHPAISVPCGTADGLPVGLMLVGRHFEEETVLRAAAGVERLLEDGIDVPIHE